jgi:hypothetical protein
MEEDAAGAFSQQSDLLVGIFDFVRMPYFKRITKKKALSSAGENLPPFIHKKLACMYAFLLPFRRKITLFKE